MIDTNVLRGKIYEKGLSQRKVAQSLGMAEKTFYSKMKRGVFDSDEIDEMIELLKITDPVPIFFTQLGT
jgi:transcriptional regulator with XRE-family HTH domain